MTIGPESSSKTSPGNIASPGPRQVVGAPIDPPPPATYDFVVSSMNVTKARSGGWLQSGDTDYATLTISALAADNTVITQYEPITQKLGDFGNNSSTDPQMSLTDLAVPEGGSLAVSFVVVNKGGWDWDSSAINALEIAGSAVLGALVQGTIVAPTTTATSVVGGVATTTTTTTATVTFSEVLAIGALIIAAMEGVNLLFPDCDGTVVPGVLSLGQTELLSYASTAPWKITYNYPGTDSPDGCGDNSEYAVTYTVANSTLRVVVPNVVGLSQEAATAALTAAKLIVETGYVEIHTSEEPLPKPKVISQYPPAGATTYASSTAVIEVTVPEPPGGHHLPQ
jgi:hypothetical protein